MEVIDAYPKSRLLLRDDAVAALKKEHIVVSFENGEYQGEKQPKLKLAVLHPERPGDSKEYQPLYEVSKPMTWRSCDLKDDNGKVSWLAKMPAANIAHATDVYDKIRHELTSREPVHVEERVVKKSGAAAWERKVLDASVADWALGSGSAVDLVHKVLSDMDMGRRKLKDLTAEEYEDFRARLFERQASARVEGAEEGSKGAKPWVKPLVLRRGGDDGDASIPMGLKYYKSKTGAVKKGKSDTEVLEQTVIKLVQRAPDGSWDLASKRTLTVEEALPMLVHSVDGTDGLSKTPFHFEAKVRYSFKHYWGNAAGMNPSVHLDTLEFCPVSSSAGIFDADIGEPAPGAGKVPSTPVAAPAPPGEDAAEAPAPAEAEAPAAPAPAPPAEEPEEEAEEAAPAAKAPPKRKAPAAPAVKAKRGKVQPVEEEEEDD